MNATHRTPRWTQRRSPGLILGATSVALLAGGAGGYVVRGATPPRSEPAPAIVAPAAIPYHGINADSSSGYASGSLVRGPSHGLNADSKGGYRTRASMGAQSHGLNSDSASGYYAGWGRRGVDPAGLLCGPDARCRWVWSPLTPARSLQSSYDGRARPDTTGQPTRRAARGSWWIPPSRRRTMRGPSWPPPGAPSSASWRARRRSSVAVLSCRRAWPSWMTSSPAAAGSSSSPVSPGSARAGWRTNSRLGPGRAEADPFTASGLRAACRA